MAVTSLNRPSPSRIDTSRRGSPSCPATAVAATGSGGATSAPSATAAAIGSPGTIALATAATARVVTNTRATASRKMGRMFAVNCRQEVRRTAAYSSGGSSRGRIRSGGTFTFGTKSTTAEDYPEERHEHRRRQTEPVPQRDAHHGPEQQDEEEGQLIHGQGSGGISTFN